MRRVVVTGMSASCPIGTGKVTNIFQEALNHKNGVKKTSDFVNLEFEPTSKFKHLTRDFQNERFDAIGVNCLAYVDKSSSEYNEYQLTQCFESTNLTRIVRLV